MFTKSRRFAVSAAVFSAVVGGVLTAAPAGAATTLSHTCGSSSSYYWCEDISAGDVSAQASLYIYRGSDGHDHADVWGGSYSYGQNVWVLTSFDGGASWSWKGYAMTADTGEESIPWEATINDVNDSGRLIKVAVYDRSVGHYIYTDAH